MQKENSFILRFSKLLGFKIRLLLRLRYKVSIKGAEIIQDKVPTLFLSNHQALIDPIILLSQIYKFSSASPVISEKYFDIPVARNYFKQMGAVRVSDLEAGSRDTQVLKSITRSTYKGFKCNRNILIYPSGQIAGQGFEKIFNKKSAYHIVNSIPENVQIVGVRISGLWGSVFSKARTGKSPNFFVELSKGIFYVFANLFFFVPKRKVAIEFVDITSLAKENVLSGQKPFNTFLEDFYNQHGPEPLNMLKHYFFLPKQKG